MRKIALILLLAISGSAWGENLYVAPTAAGSANGASCANAWGWPIQGATYWGSGAGKISAGDTLYLCPGTYDVVSTSTQLSIDGSGSAGNIITITSSDLSNQAVLDGHWTPGCSLHSACEGDVVNNSNGRTYVTVDHLTLRNCANNDCLITAGSGNFTAKFLTITNSNKHGIYCYACSSSSFLNNVIVANPTSGGTGGVGVYVFNVNNTLQSSDVTIDGNVITKAASSGIRIEGIMTPSQSCTTGCAVDTVNSKGWVLRPVVTNNDVSRSGNGVYVIGTQYAVTRGNRVHENDVAGQENYGLAGEICDQCLWEQNDSYLNARQGFESWSADTATGRQTGVVIRRNYIHDNNTGKIASACNFRLGHESGTPTNAGSNILIYANVLEGGCGMSIYDAFSGVVIANNHVLRADDTDSQLGGIFLVSGSSGTLQNNLVTAKKGYALLGSNSGNIGSWTHSTNHYYAPNSATPVRVNSVNYTDPKSWEASALTSDPTLVGGANAMGISASRLSPGSPDIGAGAVVGPYHDYLNHRFREPPSIGAFEQGSRSQAAARAARN